MGDGCTDKPTSLGSTLNDCLPLRTDSLALMHLFPDADSKSLPNGCRQKMVHGTGENPEGSEDHQGQQKVHQNTHENKNGKGDQSSRCSEKCLLIGVSMLSLPNPALQMSPRCTKMQFLEY